MLIAPSEPAVFRALGSYSPLCEANGADILFLSQAGMVGIQRKEIHDLVASKRNGLLEKELAKMAALDHRVLLIEGDFRFASNGDSLAVRHGRYRQSEHDSFETAIQGRGFTLAYTASLEHTATRLVQLERYYDNLSSYTAGSRPKPVPGVWGTRDSRDWAVHLLQSFEGIGVKQAGAIMDHLGKLPLAWTCTAEDLLAVKGIGAKRAAILIEALR